MDNTRANNAAARGTADRTNPSNTTTSTENTYVQGRIFKYLVILNDRFGFADFSR